MLLAILLIASALRLYGLDLQSLQNDEFSTLMRGSPDTAWKVIELWTLDDNHPPGYFLFSHYLQRWTDSSEIALRLPAAISGIVAVLLMAMVGAKVYGWREGLIASAFMAVLWAPVFDSQEARPYAPLLMLGLACVYLWLDIRRALACREPVPWRSVGVYVLISVLLAYLHYFGLLLVGLTGLATAAYAQRGPAVRQVVTAYAVIFLAYLPWIPVVFRQYAVFDEAEAAGGYALPAPQLCDFFSFLAYELSASQANVVLVSLLFLPWVWFGPSENAAAHDSGRHWTLPLTLWLIGPFLVAWAMSAIGPNLLHYRSLVISLPPLLLLMARAITRWPVPPRAQAALTMLLVAYFLAGLVFGMGYYTRPGKQQFREAVYFVTDRLEEPGNERSLVLGYANSATYLDYYFERAGTDHRVSAILGTESDLPAAIDLVRDRRPATVWYVAAGIDPSSAFIEGLNRELTPATYRSFLGASVWVFRTGY